MVFPASIGRYGGGKYTGSKTKISEVLIYGAQLKD